jgi:hypothetical protein
MNVASGVLIASSVVSTGCCYRPHCKNLDANSQGNVPEHVMSRFGDVAWPPHSPDLSACDFLLWGYLKQKVYVNRPHTIQDLKDNIRAEVAHRTCCRK